MANLIKKVHQVAYRCKDAKETMEWYGKYWGMDFILAIAEDQVPSTKEPDPYMHNFLDAEVATSSPSSNCPPNQQ